MPDNGHMAKLVQQMTTVTLSLLQQISRPCRWVVLATSGHDAEFVQHIIAIMRSLCYHIMEMMLCFALADYGNCDKFA